MSADSMQTSGSDTAGVAIALGVSLPPLCEGPGFSRELGDADLTAPAFRAHSKPITRSLEILGEFFDDPIAVRAWLRTPHPDLGGSTALTSILENHAEAVCLTLENALAGVPV